MAETLESVLGAETLTGLIASPMGGVPADIIPPGFMDGPARPVDGDTASWYQYANTRVAAKMRSYGGKSIPRDLTGVTERKAKCVHAFENFQHKMTTLENLRSFDSPAKQKRGKQLLAIETAESRTYLNNLRIGVFLSMLRYGKIYFGSDGQLLPSSSGALTTVDFEVPASHIANTVINEWDTASTDIAGQIAALRVARRKSSGAKIDVAFYGSGILGLLASNTQAAQILANDVTMAASFKSGVIPDGLYGIAKWYPVAEGFMESADGTQTSWFGANHLTFCPAPSSLWLETVEGSFPVPSNLRVAADAEQAAMDFSDVNGMFSYAEITTDPPGIKQMYGDTFLNCLKVPTAVEIVADAGAA